MTLQTPIDRRHRMPPLSEVFVVPRLSSREREVLSLVARGYRDRMIAEELLISHRTVTTHVTSILNKLGVESRVAAAVHAVQGGLLS